MSYCGATKFNNYIFDPEGYVYKCLATIGIRKSSIGSLSEGIDMNNHMKWVTYNLEKKCQECIRRPICQGGCPLRSIENNYKHTCSYDLDKFKLALIGSYEKLY